MKISKVLKLIDKLATKIHTNYEGEYFGEPMGDEALWDFESEIHFILTKNQICSKCNRLIEGDCVDCNEKIIKNTEVICYYCYHKCNKECDCKWEDV